MHVLVVLCHPNPNSLSHALASRFIEGAEKAGHTTELADLHLENFSPVWSLSDIEHNDGGTAPQDVLAEQTRIERCEAVCMVFPLFWFGMPAMLKGWLDRVWTWGWAYDQLDDHNKSLQKDRSCVMIIPAGANPEQWPPYKDVEKSMDTIWKTGTLGYFGFKDKQFYYLNGSTGSKPRREKLLNRAYEAGLCVTVPDDKQKS